ncbi:MAG: phospho-N-acetylmuramoyl-pentapeptide-transferase [Candidatus Melainabacteria bacterium GWF2_37_15]|nr:MAG: phospho-N-acetylmuramoyl-pentapeptide-transferase [Candidatus Melainabacteria bacterium GWF2_37_15]
MLIYIAGLLALLLTLLAGTPYLDFLKKKFYGQYICDDAPASHATKSGTPTTGGIILVLPAVIAAILALIMDQNLSIKPALVLLVFVLFMLLGFNDDYLKLAKKHNKGLTAKQKLAFQIAIALIPASYIVFYDNASLLLFGLAIFIIIGSSNAVNLADGLDGLAAGISFFTLLACVIICWLQGLIGLSIVSMAIAGSCLGFLWYNKNPAKMFMGDTGSLALGGALGTIAVLGRFELWLAIIGGVFVIETLSVIIQVISFKTTGKRIFKMSPIHHHFELSGWPETKVVYTFWIAGLIFAIIGAVLFRLYV